MMKKVLLLFTALIIVIVAALTIIIKVYLTPERVKAFLIPEAEKTLNRKISIKEVKISLFKGIQVKDFAIKEADGKTDFLKSKNFVLKYKLLPLLSKKIIIDELIILSPEVRIVRDKNGTFNFKDIGKQKEQKTKRVKDDKESSGRPVSLLISKLILKDASFSLTDHKNELPDLKGSIDIETGIESDGETGLLSEGEITLILDEILIKNPSIKHIKDLSLKLKYEISADLKTDRIRINKADIKIQEISSSLAGDITNLMTTPEIDISLSIPAVKTADILKSVKPFVDTEGFAVSGDIMADLKIKGMPEKLDTLETNGRINFKQVGVTYNNTSAVLDGDLNFKEQLIYINLKSIIKKNILELKGSIRNYFKNRKINLDIYSKKLFLSELIPPTGEKTQPAARKTGSTHNKNLAEEAKPLDLGLSAEGEIKIDSAVYKGLHMDNFYTRYQLINNRFEISGLKALIGKGEFNLKSLVDLSKPGYTYNLSFSLDSLHADELINSFFPKARDTVFGILHANFKLSGGGTHPENIKKNLIANGDFRIKDGKITNTKLSEKLAVFLGIEELRTIDLKQAKGTIKAGNGMVKLDSIFSSDDISMNPSGDIGLDGTLALAFDLSLSPGLTDKAMLNSNIVSYIKDEEGWGKIPLKVSGTFSKPSYSLDVTTAGKRMIEKKAGEILEDLFEKSENKNNGEAKKQNNENPVENLLRELFE